MASAKPYGILEFPLLLKQCEVPTPAFRIAERTGEVNRQHSTDVSVQSPVPGDREGKGLACVARQQKGPCAFTSEGVGARHKAQMLKMLTGIFQEQLHPTGEFCSQPCCPKPRLKKHSSPFWFCPASVPCLVNPG